jgi:hypothetical protein
MKCIKRVVGEKIFVLKVNDEKALELTSSGSYVYCSKDEYKKYTGKVKRNDSMDDFFRKTYGKKPSENYKDTIKHKRKLKKDVRNKSKKRK